jgi:dUTP pyrophosphatase
MFAANVLERMNISTLFVQMDDKAQLPCRKHDGDAGYDIFTIDNVTIQPNSSAKLHTGIKLAYCDPDIFFRVEARSGLGFKHGIQPHPGIIDSGYRDEVMVKLYNLSDQPYEVKSGDRIAQIVFYPLIHPTISWSSEVQSSDRQGGFGHTGR